MFARRLADPNIEKRTHPSNPASWLLDAVGARTYTGKNISEEDALSITAVWCACQILAGTIGSLPLPLYERVDIGKERAVDHPLYNLLKLKPNSEMSAISYRESMMLHLILWGNHYSEISRNNANVITELWPLLPYKMSWKRINGEIIYVYNLPDGTQALLPKDRVLHISGLSPNGLFGYNMVTKGKEALGISAALEEYAGRYFSNNAKPPVVIQHPETLGPEAADNLKKSWNEVNSGLSNSHRVAILEEGMKLQEFGADPENSQVLQSRKFSVNEVARLTNMPPHMLKDLEKATFCLPASEEVFTEHGPKSIKDVKAGEMVWSLNDDKLSLSRVKHSVCNGVDDILEIKTTNRTLRCNRNHKILVRRKYPDPQPGVGGYQHVKWENEYIPAGELKKGDTLVTLNELPHEDNTLCPTRELTVGFMEFCGLLLGDGNVIDNKSSKYITMARANDALYMDHYRNVIVNEFVKLSNSYNGKNRDSIGRLPVHINECDRQTRFSSVLAVEELKKLGLSGVARTKRVPEWVFNLSSDLKLALLRGYLDADGTVDEKGRIAFHSVNKPMLSQMRHLCMSLNIPVTNLRRQEQETTLPSGHKNSCVLFSFTCSDPGSNGEIWSHDPRYQERMLNGKPFGKKDRKYPEHGGFGFDLEGCGLARISSIKELPAEPVYDLEVEDSHSFIANGVIVHNSNIEEQGIEFVTYTLRTWLVRLEQAYTLQLLDDSQQDAFFWEHLIDGLLRGDTEKRWGAYNQGFRSGVWSPNDIRAMENKNKVEGGDQRFIDGNLFPLEHAADVMVANKVTKLDNMAGSNGGDSDDNQDDERNSEKELRGDFAQKETAEFYSNIERIEMNFQPLLEIVAQLVLNKEVNSINRAAQKFLNTRGGSDFRIWMETFYSELPEFMKLRMLPTQKVFLQQVSTEVAERLGGLKGWTMELEQWTQSYMDVYIKRHIGSSMGQLDEILKGVDKDVYEEITKRTAQWQAKRAAKIAKDEMVRESQAMVRHMAEQAGVKRMVWRTDSDPCPFCAQLNGKTVSIDQPFLKKREPLVSQPPEGQKQSTIYMRSDKFHPPIHSGCECRVVPEGF